MRTTTISTLQSPPTPTPTPPPPPPFTNYQQKSPKTLTKQWIEGGKNNEKITSNTSSSLRRAARIIATTRVYTQRSMNVVVFGNEDLHCAIEKLDRGGRGEGKGEETRDRKREKGNVQGLKMKFGRVDGIG